MTKYVIDGGKTLNGEVTISGAKNAAVAIVPAALLELPDKNAVIKAQIPTGVLLLIVNVFLLYFLMFL